MDEFMWLRMFGGSGGGLDLAALVAFIAYGIVYLIAPVLGYEEYRPAALVLAMWLIVGYGGATLLQLFANWMLTLERAGGAFGRRDMGLHIIMGFSVLKLGVFLASMIAFIIGLRALRLKPPESDSITER